MKYLFYSIVCICFCTSLPAQKVQVKDLAGSLGSWEGKLTYLDYSSGKPYTMAANIHIGFTQDKKGYIMDFEYPAEPNANSKDTTYIQNNFFGKDKIVALTLKADGGFTMVTEIAGEDGNDHKKAILRHTYSATASTYSIMKEVKFQGSDKWIKRNEYLCNKINK